MNHKKRDSPTVKMKHKIMPTGQEFKLMRDVGGKCQTALSS